MQGITMLEPVAASTERFVSTVTDLGDARMGGTTLVPPWTRGHVVTHVARASDSLCRLLEWARTGVEVPQYPSMDARAAEIEAGAGRPAHEQVRDVVETAARLDEAVRTLPAPAWQAVVRPRTGEMCTPERLVAIRLRELEVHHADLDAGYSFADVPEPTARLIIDDIVETQSGRDGTAPLRIRATDVDLDRELGERGPVVTGTLAGILAWLTGRSDGSPGPAGGGLSVSGADAVPAAPYWI